MINITLGGQTALVPGSVFLLGASASYIATAPLGTRATQREVLPGRVQALLFLCAALGGTQVKPLVRILSSLFCLLYLLCMFGWSPGLSLAFRVECPDSCPERSYAKPCCTNLLSTSALCVSCLTK